MKLVHAALLACVIVAALLLFGCAQSGMEEPKVCHSLCSPGQTQAPYPDCSCSGTPYGGGGT
jgi:hypothetical protein